VKIRVEVDEEVLSMIGELCPKLKTFEYHKRFGEKYLFFGQKYGHKLEKIYINFVDISFCKKFLDYCPNLKIACVIQDIIFDDRKEFLPNLEYCNCLINTDDVQNFKKLCQKYSKTMKRIDIILDGLTDEDVKTCLLSITKLVNLKTLGLSVNSYLDSVNKQPIDKYIVIIGQ
jgi:hypothetical protein